MDGLSLEWTGPVSPLSPGTTANPGKKSLKLSLHQLPHL